VLVTETLKLVTSPKEGEALSWKGRDRASILTLAGRIIVPAIRRGRWPGTTGTTLRGAADLIYRDGEFYVAVVIDVPEPPPGPEPTPQNAA
jgi:hypothetical protein